MRARRSDAPECAPLERRARDFIGGGLRPRDPRRFLVEAMLGAMNADGTVDPRELGVLHRQLDDHELFTGLAEGDARTLIELASDAIFFAGSAVSRVGAIARGLPARLYRLAAYAMACEVSAVDALVGAAEAQFLEELRLAVRVGAVEAQAIFQAAREGRVVPFLEDRIRRLRGLVPVAIELFAVRAWSYGTATDEHRVALRGFFLAVPDLTLRIDALDDELRRAFRRPRTDGAPVHAELYRLAAALPDPVDRYWMAVYALLAEPRGPVPSWRAIPFAAALQQAFGIDPGDMELAAADAHSFPATLPRPC